MEGSIRSPGCGDVMHEEAPLAYPAALRALTGCFGSTARLLWQRRLHLPTGRVTFGPGDVRVWPPRRDAVP